jgi:MFS family permease
LRRALNEHTVADERLVTGPFAFAWLATFGSLLAVGMLIPVLPVYAEGPLGVGTIGVGIAVAAASPTALLMQPVAGRLGDRRGRRPLVVVGCVILSASIVSYTAVGSLAAIVCLRLIGGVGEALLFVGSATVVNDLAPPRRRGEAVSLYSLAVWGGLAAGPPLGELVLRGDDYDTVWLLAAVSALVAALAGTRLPETRPADLVGEPGRQPFVHRAALLPGLVLVLSMIGFAGMAAFAPLYARELGLSGAGLVFALNAVIVIGVRSIGRRLPDRVGPRRTATAAMALAATGLGLIAVVHSPAGLYAGTAVLACGQALAFPALMTIVVSGAPAAQRSAAVGSFTAAADVGYAIGAVSLGAVAAGAGYRGVFAVAAVVVACGLLPLTRIPRASGVLAPAATDAPP